ncbi:YaaA family protein [Cellulomonas endophytica]|uniref:YaaA family protein n=1 Tax=Cellulomonas endophytica TaxID=2494735 RepID=UPI0013E92CB8|nr:peroxide stress protein YaaA [Cellulomonas endophytica]
MLLVLPPSEGKRRPAASGAPLDLDALHAPVLTPDRAAVLEALVATSARPDALALLGAGASLADEVAANTGLATAPTAPARRVYSGVLYAAAGLDGLTGAARTRAGAQVRTVSALFGALTPEDRVPAYRLSMGTGLPGLGALGPWWRPRLSPVLDAAALDPGAGAGLVVDARSAAYLAAWHPPAAATWVAVRVEQDVDGTRSVVSHHAKHARGVLVRHLLVRRGRAPQDADELAHAATGLVATGAVLAVELGPPVRRGARTLTLVVPPVGAATRAAALPDPA